jgi:hypothetical protein
MINDDNSDDYYCGGCGCGGHRDDKLQIVYIFKLEPK